jgi:dihydrofolate reductase
LAAEMAELKSGGGSIAVFAGPGAVNALLPYLDEVRLLVYPVVLGAGLPLFTTAGPRLRLMETRPFAASGAVQLRYRIPG